LLTREFRQSRKLTFCEVIQIRIVGYKY